MTSKPIEDRYLGDGVYASYDGCDVVLELRDQPPTLPITRIVLEPSVLTALNKFLDIIAVQDEQADAAAEDADREMFGDDAGFDIPWGDK